MANDSSLHVVLGAGQVGGFVAEELLARGRRVRLVRRGPPGAAKPGLSWVSGDATDPAFCREVAAGASVIYHCMTPGYDEWPALMPPLQHGALAAARSSGARLVVLDNLYMYGRGDGRPYDEDTTVAPISKKGELRARLTEELFAAHTRGDALVTCGRASDFFGPRTAATIALGGRFYERIRDGRSAQMLGGDPDKLHSFSYTPDVARALVTLGERDEALGKIWHLPVAKAETTRQVIARFAAAFGRDIRISRVPDAALRVAGVFSSLIREVAEMTYQFQMDYVLDDRRFRETFGGVATPLDEAVPATAVWARDAYTIAPTDRTSRSRGGSAYSMV